MADIASSPLSCDILNIKSNGFPNQNTQEIPGMDVYKEYMMKLLPYNQFWIQSSLTNGNTVNNDEISKDWMVDGSDTSSKITDKMKWMSLQNDEVNNNSNFRNTIHNKFPIETELADRVDINNSYLVNNIDETECPIEIAVSDTVGRYLMAKRNITAGEVILVEPPVALATRPKSPPHCSSCYTLTTTLKCQDCGFFLCGKNCMPEHKKIECNILKKLGAAEPMNDGEEDKHISDRLAQMPEEKRKEAQNLLEKVRASAKEQRHSEVLQQYVIMATLRTLLVVQNNEFYMKLVSLMQANLEPGNSRYLMNKKLIVDVIVQRLQVTKDAALLHRICSAWDTNAFQAVLPQNGRVQGLYPLTALMNHDCSPNTQQWFNERGDIVLRATENIPKGRIMSISYTDPQWSTIVRQNHLQKCKQFTCTCSRCLDPTEMGTYVGSIICPVCRSPMVSSNPLNVEALWVCTKTGCDQEIPAVKDNENKILSLGTHLGLLTQRVNPGDVTGVVSLAKVLQRQVHPNHFCLMQMYMRVLSRLSKMDLTELGDKELSCLCDVSTQVMTVLRKLQAPLARVTATTAREDMRLRLEKIRRDRSTLGDDEVQQRLKEMSDDLHTCKQVLDWDVSLPSSKTLLEEYNRLVE